MPQFSEAFSQLRAIIQLTKLGWKPIRRSEVEEYKKVEGEKLFGENKYNDEICKNNKDFALFDRKVVNFSNDKIEICDIYCPEEKIFYHIKRGNKASTMSHLWAQGSISARCANAENKEYINKFGEVLSTNDKPPKASNMKIYYGIICKNQRLPIFSKISFYDTIESLKQTGVEPNNIKYFFINEV